MPKPVMVSISGIRGIVGEGLTPELIVNFSAAAGTFYGDGNVMVGRDSRVTGEMVKAAVFSGLMSVGCNPVDLGICSTPTVEMAVKNSDAVGGIIITASHNPLEWNALKLLTSEGLFLDQEEGEKIKQIIEGKQFSYAPWNKIGEIKKYNRATEDHIEAVLKIPYINVEKIRKRKFKVAFDCVNGAGGTIIPELLKELGCETFPMNEEPTGFFAHTPEPVPANLKDLSEHVKKNKAEIGFAVDPDVDRCAIVAETGEPLGEEYTVTLATKLILSKKKGPVTVNISTTRAVDDVASKFGIAVTRTPVGEINVAKKMKEINAVIGGEGNGGVILPNIHLGRDAPVAIVLTLQHITETGGTISELWKSLPQYVMTKKKIDIGSSNPDEILEKIKDAHSHEKLNLIDGIKIERPTSWVHIRKSNTEPIIRVIAEAKTKKESEELCNSFLKEIDRSSPLSF